MVFAGVGFTANNNLNLTRKDVSRMHDGYLIRHNEATLHLKL